MEKFSLTVAELRRQLEGLPDNANVCLCVDEFPCAMLYGAISYERGEVGTVLLGLHPETDLADFLRRKDGRSP